MLVLARHGVDRTLGSRRASSRARRRASLSNVAVRAALATFARAVPVRVGLLKRVVRLPERHERGGHGEHVDRADTPHGDCAGGDAGSAGFVSQGARFLGGVGIVFMVQKLGQQEYGSSFVERSETTC